MFIRLSTTFVVLLGLTALVNAGVPAARHAAPLDKRSTLVMTRANYLALAREESPEPDPGKAVVTGRSIQEESPEPDPGKAVVTGREETPEPDPGKAVVTGREETPEPDPGKAVVTGREETPEPDPGKHGRVYYRLHWLYGKQTVCQQKFYFTCCKKCFRTRFVRLAQELTSNINIRENLLPQISARVLDTSTSSCSAPNQSSPERREGARPLRSTSSCSKPSQSSPERREGTAGIVTPKIEDARARATAKRGKVNILLTMLGHAGKLREKDCVES
ncbi:uncharacterized protein F5891DRAFT_979163 [Suillus fuscotomentosus]|uniref:Uncharacterized protein n=1 Tax=Suillus fuscotomentosus TaxID=1912939 RepID=A0AAD4E9Y1_9AGAM|nr:uncharacterized protein F5891DRAFT_979163 [Suillus fuscotomentosus]KAG1902056.1 hypothetical protein F5891DRAFT_979163 [Suillus fuscotomentosus]